MEILAFLFYLGGVMGCADDFGFWETTLWPYHLGKILANKITN